jgi:hypothetical protein
MTENQETSIELSRADLYELVWSKPMVDLAKDFGISDVGLAKRCRRLGIPVPGRGYWARVDAGQQPYRPTLPQREPEYSDRRALTVETPIDDPGVPEFSHASSEDEAWLQERLTFEQSPDNTIQLPAKPKEWHPVIQEFREDLELAAEEMRESRSAHERFEKLPASRKRVFSDPDASTWRWVKDRGQRLWDTHGAVAFRVSLDTYKRALGLTNSLALSAVGRGFSVRDDDDAGRIAFAGHDAEILIYVTEILEKKTRPRVRYDGKTEQETFKVPTGRLRIALQLRHGSGSVFEDRESQKLESQLNRVFTAMYRLVVKSWHEERERRERQRQWDERERVRIEAERIRAAHKRAVAEERARRRYLSIEATKWIRATRIRDYVAHIQASAKGKDISPALLNDWTKWALLVASELDPTEFRLSKAANVDTG